MSQFFIDANASGLPTIDTVTGNIGGAVGPDASNNITIVGTGSVSVSGNPATNTLTISSTSGTVTSVSVVSANGFAGTVATATTTPAITLTTSITGVLSGNGTAMTGSLVTQYGTIVAGSSNSLSSVAPSATIGVPLISQGASANPIYGTALVVGGGTGVTSVTTSPTALAFAGWDSNRNLSADNFIYGYATTATAAGTTTLTVDSVNQQYFTGVTTQTVVLPVASTMVLGQRFMIMNNSTGVVTVNSSGGNLVQSMATMTMVNIVCVLTSGTTAASWNVMYSNQAGGSVTSGTVNQLAYYAATGNVVSGLATANSAILVTSGAGVPSISTTVGADLYINTVRVGLGNASIASNTCVGTAAAAAITTGTTSVFVGNSAGFRVTDGDANTFVGYSCASNVTTSDNNCAFGVTALNAVTTGGLNCAFGPNAMLNSATVSNENVAVGYNALLSQAGGVVVGNVAIGSQSLAGTSLTGDRNSAVGRGTFIALTSANDNSVIGYDGFKSLTTGGVNVGMGRDVGGAIAAGSVATTTGTDNTFIGYASSANSAAAIGTIAIGSGAVATIATGATSSDIGPGISFGSVANDVGFRGDGTIFPSTTGAGFWRPMINGTAYLVPLIASGATAWPAITTSSVTFSSTSGVIGTTTNDSAAALSVGELLSTVVLVGAPVALTTATAANIATLSLTAGDWDVWGSVWTNPAAGTTTTKVQAAVSQTTATLPTTPALGTSLSVLTGITTAATEAVVLQTGATRISLAGTTSVYLVASVTFSVSTMGGYGAIYARRRR